MQIYPSPIFATSSGSTGTSAGRNMKLNAFGVSAIFAQSIYLDKDSAVSSGYSERFFKGENKSRIIPEDYVENGSSGGSLFIMAQFWTIYGEVSANGEPGAPDLFKNLAPNCKDDCPLAADNDNFCGEKKDKDNHVILKGFCGDSY